jgi:nitrate reductase NapE
MARAAPKKSKRPVKSGKSVAAKSKKPNPKSRELSAFLFLTVFLAPGVVVALVGSYGFAIWMYQLIAGPPGAP